MDKHWPESVAFPTIAVPVANKPTPETPVAEPAELSGTEGTVTKSALLDETQTDPKPNRTQPTQPTPTQEYKKSINKRQKSTQIVKIIKKQPSVPIQSLSEVSPSPSPEFDATATGTGSTPSGSFESQSTSGREQSQDVTLQNERGQWANQIEYLLSLLGYVVGYGNVWRFPYLVYSNGGGAFLIPYLLFLLLAGLPIVYLEMCIGQFSNFGPVNVFTNMAPVFQGLGWGITCLLTAFVIYYNIVVAWSILYTFASFRSALPWKFCDNDFNTYTCYSEANNDRCRNNDSFGPKSVYFGGNCTNDTSLLSEYKIDRSEGNLQSAAEQYFYLYLYQRNSEEPAMGSPLQWHLSLCLLAAWALTFVCVVRGVRSMGLIVYFTTLFPYVVLILFLIFGATLKGASEGYRHLKADYSHLESLKPWVLAASQVLYSVSVGFGCLTTLSSYNRYHHIFFRDALISCLVDTVTSFLAVFVVFSLLGHISYVEDTDLSQIVQVNGTTGDSALVFVVVAQAIAYLPGSVAWSVLFFVMFIAIGLTTQVVAVESLVTVILDQLPSLLRWRWLVVAILCVSMFLLGLPMCVKKGYVIFALFNDYVISYSILYVVLIEAICCVYVYGVWRLLDDVRRMIGSRSKRLITKIIGPTGWYWGLTLLVITPLLLGIAMVGVFAVNSSQSHSLHSPKEGLFGWTFTFIPLFVILLLASIKVVCGFLVKQPIALLFRPTKRWCPANQRPNY